ncbi:AmmeMemoRadiSam system protein B [Galenea microaerophila]
MNHQHTIRPAAVAGMFYPADPITLEQMFAQWMPEAEIERLSPEEVKRLKALIVPHAGYVYSGEVAAKAYEQLVLLKDEVDTIVIFGPAHRFYFEGIATISNDAVETPFGALEVDTQLRNELVGMFPKVGFSDEVNAPEHSIEVQFPFIKYLAPEVKVLPLLIGDVDTQTVAQLMEVLWHRPRTLMVISSDLSHYHPYEEAKQIDSETAELIEYRHPEQLNGERACGFKGIQGILSLPEKFKIKRLAFKNSGDTAGDKDRVVGYGAWAILAED